MSGKSRQLDLIANRLLAGESVDSVSAGTMGIWRLSSIIYRLRRRGWPISAECDHNNGLAHYSIPKNWTPRAGMTEKADKHDHNSILAETRFQSS